MTEVERQGWYVVPATLSPNRRAAAIRRVVLGWAIVRALDAHARHVSI